MFSIIWGVQRPSCHDTGRPLAFVGPYSGEHRSCLWTGVVLCLLTIPQNGLSYLVLARVPLLLLPLALSGHSPSSLDRFLWGCLSLVLPAELSWELGLPRVPVIEGPCLHCQRFHCHNPISIITCPASPWNILGSRSTWSQSGLSTETSTLLCW